jgi:hypothetical protein
MRTTVLGLLKPAGLRHTRRPHPTARTRPLLKPAQRSAPLHDEGQQQVMQLPSSERPGSQECPTSSPHSQPAPYLAPSRVTGSRGGLPGCRLCAERASHHGRVANGTSAVLNLLGSNPATFVAGPSSGLLRTGGRRGGGQQEDTKAVAGASSGVVAAAGQGPDGCHVSRGEALGAPHSEGHVALGPHREGVIGNGCRPGCPLSAQLAHPAAYPQP